MTLKVRMLSSQRGSEDGFHIKDFTAGVEYNMCEDLAGVFLGKHWAELVIDKQTENSTSNGTDKPEASETKLKAGGNRRRR